MRANIVPLRAGMKPRRAVDAVAIEQRHRRHLQLDRALDQLLRLRGCFEKAESAGSVEFDIATCHKGSIGFTAMYLRLIFAYWELGVSMEPALITVHFEKNGLQTFRLRRQRSLGAPSK